MSDAPALARLAESTFRDAFSAQNSPEDMALHCRASYGESIQAQEIASPDSVIIVAEDAGQLAAYAQLRWGLCPECVAAASPGEIQRLYVKQSFHGRGLAQRLMARCLQLLEDRHSDVAWLGVWENNPRAVAFYRKFDFQPVGEHVFMLGSDPQRDIILMRPLQHHGTL